MANQANKTRKRRAVERSFGAGILTFNEPAGCRAERQADERRRHLLSMRVKHVVEGVSAMRLALGICFQWIVVAPHCVIDSLGEHRLSDRSSATRGQTRPGLTSSSSWVVRSFGPRDGLVPPAGSK